MKMSGRGTTLMSLACVSYNAKIDKTITSSILKDNQIFNLTLLTTIIKVRKRNFHRPSKYAR
jgi:hypothetical protein